jgi:DNA-binding LytR/AlgR family response regulator
VKCNGKIEKIVLADIIFIEAMSNYVIIHTRQKKFITWLTFKGIVNQLPENLFLRIHKSYLVSLSAILTIDGDEIITSESRLPLSKTYKEKVMSIIESKTFKR